MSTKQAAPLTIVVMGLDKDGHPKAVAYPSEMADVAEKAAQVWKLRLGKAKSPAALTLAKDLPHGELFPSNKMGPPTIKRETYNLLLKTIQCDDDGDNAPAHKPNESAAPRTESFNPWNELKVGDTVLWQTDPTEGYFPARIESISKDRKTVSLRWKQWPSYPLVKAPRIAVGLIQVIR